MWTHINNSDIRQENGMYVCNAFFKDENGTDMNTGLGFDHVPTEEEIAAAVAAFLGTL